MTIYAAFNECEALDNATEAESSGQTAVSGVARAGFKVKNVGTETDVTLNYTLPSGPSEGWVHVMMYNAEATDSQENPSDIFRVFDNDNNEIVAVYASNDTTGNIYMNSTLNGSNTLIGNRFETVFTIDIHIKIDASGFIKGYLDQTAVYEEAGNTVQSTSGTEIGKLQFFQTQNRVFSLTDTTKVSWGQVLVSDKPTFNANVYTLTPTAGSTNTWDVGSVTDVDESGVSDADQINTSGNGDEFIIDTSDTLSSSAAPANFRAVVQSFRASYDASATATNIVPFLNDTTATSTSNGTTKSLSTGFDHYQEIWNTDPADSSDWTASKINNYEFGIRTST